MGSAWSGARFFRAPLDVLGRAEELLVLEGAVRKGATRFVRFFRPVRRVSEEMALNE